jgi:uncharacterized protein YecE (DUF72 family)
MAEGHAQSARKSASLRIGTAGWSIPKALASEIGGEGQHLQRYARQFDAAEINSTFHRSHRASTLERWASSVPPHFRFSVKLPKVITHERKLIDCAELLAAFADELRPLDAHLGPVLVQLPPSLAFDPLSAGFFAAAARVFGGSVVCEPRHPSWFGGDADKVLTDHGVARVAADPAIVPEAACPGGARHLAYFRLHGSPVMYRSSYDAAFLTDLGEKLTRLRDLGVECWTIFDNTASGAALADALVLRQQLNPDSPTRGVSHGDARIV